LKDSGNAGDLFAAGWLFSLKTAVDSEGGPKGPKVSGRDLAGLNCELALEFVF
jgi:hypothetical protein